MQKKLLVFGVFMVLLSSCKLLGIGSKSGSNSAKQDNGCPSNGRNVGAEKLLSGDNKIKKAPKYTKDKSLTY